MAQEQFKQGFWGRPCFHVLMAQRKSDQDQSCPAELASMPQAPCTLSFAVASMCTEGICLGRRPELTGGGLICSLGGWSAVKSMRRLREHVKSDARILGDSDFVQSVLSASKLLGISQPAVTRAAYRGEAIAAANNLNLVETHNA